MKICADTKSLCMQFESVVTNSSLTFADIQFLEINQEIAAILKLSEIGNVDWQQLLDDIASVAILMLTYILLYGTVMTK